jgi:hypothetical protein
MPNAEEPRTKVRPFMDGLHIRRDHGRHRRRRASGTSAVEEVRRAAAVRIGGLAGTTKHRSHLIPWLLAARQGRRTSVAHIAGGGAS